MFRAKVIEEIKNHILSSVICFFQKSCRLGENVEEHGRAGQATDGNTAHTLCMLND